MKRSIKHLWPLFLFVVFLIGWISSGIAHGATVVITPADDFQTAINRAGVGGTVQLAPGTYSILKTVTMLQGQTIKGTTQIKTVAYNDTVTLPGFSIPSTTYTFAAESIIASGNKLHAIIPADNCKILNITATGSLIWGNGEPKNLEIAYSYFNTLVTESAHPTVIESSYAFRGLNIHDCVFREGQAGVCDTFIYFYAYTGSIKNCQFIGGRDGIHIANSDGSTIDATVEECHFAGQRANPVEYQGGGRNFQLLNCWQDTPNYGSPLALMGFTLPADRSNGTKATGNVVLALNQSNANNRQRVGFEFSAPNITCTGNLVMGVRKPVTITNAQGSGTVKDNHFEDYPENSDTNGGKVAVTNNRLPELKAALLARGRPGPLTRLGQSPPLETDPATDPVPVQLRIYLQVDYINGKITVTPVATPTLPGTL